MIYSGRKKNIRDVTVMAAVASRFGYIAGGVELEHQWSGGSIASLINHQSHGSLACVALT